MAIIPKANKHEDTAVNQHLVPQCYMREWGYNARKSSVWRYSKGKEPTDTDINSANISCSSKATKKINYIENYYDIKAGCFFMPQEALEEIFGPTMHLIAKFENEILDTEEKRNDRFGLLDEWIITDEDGKALTEDEFAELKKYFEEARFVFIEKEWDRQYENNWRAYIKDFEAKIRDTKNGAGCVENGKKTVSTIITADMISEIIKLLIVFDIRGFYSDEYINEQIDSIFNIIPELAEMKLDDADRMHPVESTVKECFRHQFILHLCYDILKDNEMSGIVKTIWEGYKSHLVPRFCLTDINHPFVTSERPVFMNTLESGEKEQIFVALPTMLITIGRGDSGQFFICNLTPDDVTDYNKIIARNNDNIISCTDKLDMDIIFG